MKKFWWGIFFGTLIGILLLLPDSKISYRIREIFYVAQYTAYDVFLAVSVYSTFIVAGVLWFLNSYLKPYLAKKSENLATKQDIGEITKLTEEVKIEFDGLREDHKTQSALRLAVLEKRFQTHQDAYSRWVIARMFAKKGDTNASAELLSWWMSNNLYLDIKPRRAFNDMMIAHSYVTGYFEKPLGMSDDEITRRLDAAGPIIEGAVGLPPIELPESGLKDLKNVEALNQK